MCVFCDPLEEKNAQKRLVQLVKSCFLPKKCLFSVSLCYPPADQRRSEASAGFSVESVAFIYSVVGFPPAEHGGGRTVKSVGSYNKYTAGGLRYLLIKEHLKHFLACLSLGMFLPIETPFFLTSECALKTPRD